MIGNGASEIVSSFFLMKSPPSNALRVSAFLTLFFLWRQQLPADVEVRWSDRKLQSVMVMKCRRFMEIY